MEAGHTFLARLGKKRLRPGGKRATEWLLEQGNIQTNTNILEVACNMGTTSIELAQRFHCPITACDLDENALSKARINIKKTKLENKIKLCKENAMELSFSDDTFDVVINEAMLTMMQIENKQKAIREYHRVLKETGVLLTHDVVLRTNDPAEQKQIIAELSRAIHIAVQPLTKQGWEETFKLAGFSDISILSGDMTLMTPRGMLYDEGFVNATRVISRGLKRENRKMFFGMASTFRKWCDKLGFIAVCSRR